ncbi:MAG: succinate dehydrogenase, hydrophobic membrane anchor protein [bacterium]
MATYRERGVRSGGAFIWFFQRVTGIVLLLALIIHFWVLHFFAPEHGNITYDNVMTRLQHPLWRTFDLLFLVFGIYHGMNGVMIVVYDYIRAKGLRLTVMGTLWVAAIFFLIIGAMTILGLSGKGI